MNSFERYPEDPSGQASTPGMYYLHARPEVVDLVPITAQRILDVGCGAGGLSATLKARQSAEIHGVEIVEQAAEHARHHLDHVWNSGIEAALPELPDGYYDCIVIADVLEHLLDPLFVLSELKKKLTGNGKLIASIPNIQNWGVLSELLQGKWDYRSEGILDRTHLRFFTRKSVQELFWSAGLRIARLTAKRSGPPPPGTFLNALKRIGLSARELALDGETFQFLIEAEVPDLSAKPKVSVVILNWNGKVDTLECLASATQLDYQNYELVVVDNGSTDDSVAAISKQYPDITLLQTGANLGYAGGNNVGLHWALEHGADYLLILNNDTVVPPDLLSNFVNSAKSLPTGSVLGARIYFHDKPDTLWFAGGFWRSAENSVEHLGCGQKDCVDTNYAEEVDYITGCALFADAATFRQVGLLDEQFFLTFEETDWCYRARALGHKCIVTQDAKLWHKVSASFGGSDSPLVNYFITRNKLLWAKKHLPQRDRISLHKDSLRILWRIIFPQFNWPQSDSSWGKKLLWTFSTWVKTIRRNIHNPTNKATMMGLRDYYLGRFGNCPDRVRELAKSARQAVNVGNVET